MKIPGEIKIGGHVYAVQDHDFMEDDCMGQFFDAAKKIVLRNIDFTGKELPLSYKWNTFIHEVLHAIDFLHGESIFNRNEDSIDAYGDAVYQILVDNGWLKLELGKEK